MEFGKEHLVYQQGHSSIYIVQMVGQELKQLVLYRDAKWSICAPSYRLFRYKQINNSWRLLQLLILGDRVLLVYRVLLDVQILHATNYDPSATVDDGSCIYGPILSQIDLPITWDDSTVDYTVTDFGGAVSSLSQDPLNSSNSVLMTDKAVGSQSWAGTTLSTSNGFVNAIPFTSGATTMTSTCIFSIWE